MLVASFGKKHSFPCPAALARESWRWFQEAGTRSASQLQWCRQMRDTVQSAEPECETAECVRQYPVDVLIPAYRPNRTLVEVVTALAARGVASIIVKIGRAHV